MLLLSFAAFLANTAPHGGYELQQIVEPVFDDISDDREIDGVVPVHEHIPEPDHVPHGRGERRRQPRVALEQIEQLSVRARLAMPSIRDDVRGDVERCLNRQLQRVFHETFLADVVRELRRAREPP